MKIRIDPLDRLFALYILARDKYCQRLGCTSGLQTAHFFGRAKKSVRWDEDNACLLCFGCHQYFHSHPLEFTEWFQERLGDKFDLLRARAYKPGKPDKEILALYYNEKIKGVRDEG